MRVFDVATSETVALLGGRAGGVIDATWSPRDDSLLTGGTAGDVRRWSPAALYPTLARTTDPHLPSLSDPVAADEGGKLGLRHGDDRLRLFDAATLALLGEHPGVRWPLRLTPPPRRAVVGRLRRGLLANGAATVAPHAFSPDGARLVIGGTAGTIQVFATEDWREITSLVVDLFARPEQRQLVTALEFSRDGRSLVATTENGRTKVWRW